MTRKTDAARDLKEYATSRLLADSGDGTCKICGEKAVWFDVLDFNKSCVAGLYPRGLAGIPVFYKVCLTCGFVFTDFFDQFTPEQWREHVYNEEYADADPEYSDLRPRRNALEIEAFLSGRRADVIGLDYGGGNGQTAALLRRQGWVYDTYDPFGHNDLVPDRVGRYNFCSAFEVFEHSPEPADSLRAIIQLCSPGELMVLISTGISDQAVGQQSRLGWWYAAPRNGHISLYSRKSLQILAGRYSLDYASVSAGTHLLFRGMSIGAARRRLLCGKLLKRLRLLIMTMGIPPRATQARPDSDGP